MGNGSLTCTARSECLCGILCFEHFPEHTLQVGLRKLRADVCHICGNKGSMQPPLCSQDHNTKNSHLICFCFCVSGCEGLFSETFCWGLRCSKCLRGTSIQHHSWHSYDQHKHS